MNWNWRQDRGVERPGVGHSNPSTLTPKGGALGHGQALLTVFITVYLTVGI